MPQIGFGINTSPLEGKGPCWSRKKHGDLVMDDPLVVNIQYALAMN